MKEQFSNIQAHFRGMSMLNKIFFLIAYLLINTNIYAQNAKMPQYSSGVYPSKNFIVNSDFEVGMKLADYATDANTISSRSTSSPLQGKASLLIDAATSGHLVDLKTISAGIDSMLAGGNCQAIFYVSGDASLYKTAVFLSSANLSGYTQLENIASGSRKVNLFFPCGAAADRPVVRIEATSNSAAAIKVDGVYLGACIDCGSSSVVTAWKDCASVAAGTLITAETANPAYGGTVQNNICRWRRVGASAQIEWDYRHSTAGTAGTGIIYFNIPSEIGTIDTTYKPINTNTTAGTYDEMNSGVGHAVFVSSSAYIFNCAAVPHSSSKVKFHCAYNGASDDAEIFSGTSAGFAGTKFGASVRLSVPIAGWANVDSIRMDCAGTANCENHFAASVGAAGGAVSKENVDWINGDCTGTAIKTCTFNTSLFSAAPVCGCTVEVSGANHNTCRVESISTTTLVYNTGLDNVSDADRKANVWCDRQLSDRKPQVNAPILVGGVTSGASGTLRIESAYITNTGTPTVSTTSNSSWISSITDNSTGDMTINFGTGIWTQTPWCQVTASPNSDIPASPHIYDFGTATSTTAVRVRTLGNASALTDMAVRILCMGVR